MVLAAISKSIQGAKRETELKVQIKKKERVIRLHQKSGNNFTIKITPDGIVEYKFEEATLPTVKEYGIVPVKGELISEALEKLYDEVGTISWEYIHNNNWHMLIRYICGYIAMFDNWREALQDYLANYGYSGDEQGGWSTEARGHSQAKTNARGKAI